MHTGVGILTLIVPKFIFDLFDWMCVLPLCYICVVSLVWMMDLDLSVRDSCV